MPAPDAVGLESRELEVVLEDADDVDDEIEEDTDVGVEPETVLEAPEVILDADGEWLPSEGDDLTNEAVETLPEFETGPAEAGTGMELVKGVTLIVLSKHEQAL